MESWCLPAGEDEGKGANALEDLLRGEKDKEQLPWPSYTMACVYRSMFCCPHLFMVSSGHAYQGQLTTFVATNHLHRKRNDTTTKLRDDDLILHRALGDIRSMCNGVPRSIVDMVQ